MKGAGYTAPNNEVDRAVAMLPDFQENGFFSAARYRQMDSNRRMSLWRQMRDSLTVDHYVSDMTGLRVPSGESAFISAMASPQRRFDLASFSLSTYPDSEIAAYVQANPAMFRVTHFSKITINSEREARQIFTSLQNGTESFEDAARNKSTDYYAENYGDMGSRMVFELLSDIPNEQSREELMNLERGAMSGVIRFSDTNFGIFRAEERVRPANTSDPAVMEKIRNYMMTYERGRAEDWVIAEAERFIAGVRASDFDTAATERGISKRTFGPVPINYGNAILFPSISNSGVSEVSNAGSNENFWQAAFSAPVNSPSTPVVLGTNVVVLYPLEETEASSDDIDLINMYYSYWLSNNIEQDIRSYFLNNDKLDDRFWDVFQQIFY